MKHSIILFAICFCLFGCKSREEKAAELIKKEMFKTLYDFDSYEPIETIIDSAFTSASTDSITLAYAYLTQKTAEKTNENLEKMQSAQQTMEIWSDSYSSYSESRFNSAKEEYELNLKEAQARIKSLDDLKNKIKERAKEIPHNFYGWQVKHKFRCKNKGGNFDLGNQLYIFDKDFKRIIYTEDLDDKELIEAKEFIKEIINEKETLKEDGNE